jgi:hypothetical protein
MNERIYLDNCCFNRPYDDQAYLTIKLESEAKLFVQKDSFDYTKWRENLFDDMTLEELSQKAMEYRRNRQ